MQHQQSSCETATENNQKFGIWETGSHFTNGVTTGEEGRIAPPGMLNVKTGTRLPSISVLVFFGFQLVVVFASFEVFSCDLGF